MTADGIPDALDALLARSAPPTSAPGAKLDAAIDAVVAQTRAPARLRRFRWSRRSVVLTAIGATVVVTGGALAATAGAGAWMPWAPGMVTDRTTMEWQVTWPDGTLCVNRLTATHMSDADVAAAVQILRDPHVMVTEDGGKVRQLFLTDFALPDVDMEGVLDRVYDSVEHLDIDAGRGDLKEEDLGSMPPSAEDDVFKFSHMRLVEDSLVALLAKQGIDAHNNFTPDTACVVAPGGPASQTPKRY